MDYRAVLTLDYSGTRDVNANARLLNALDQAGWEYAETSAMYVEAQNLTAVLLGLEILARYVDAPGTLSALTLQVQLVGPPREPPAKRHHKQALKNVLDQPVPSESI
jgi:hypothetical protein